MNLGKVLALVYRDLLIIRRSKWRLVETFYFPITNIIIWGLFAVHSSSLLVESGVLLLIVNIFWNYALIAQSTVNMQLMEDSWSGSLKQLFLSGISEVDYIVARMISSSVVSAVVILVLLAISPLFGWNPLNQWPLVLALTTLTLITSLAMAVLITALIMLLGRSYGFLAWTALQLFVLLSAPFFPVEVFPQALQYVAKVMPYTYVFASTRALAQGGQLFLWQALAVAVMYMVLVWPVYILAFRFARKNGNLVRLG